MIGWFSTIYSVLKTVAVNGALVLFGVVALVFWEDFNAIGRTVGVAALCIQAVRAVLFIRELRDDARDLAPPPPPPI